jgi:hypothetical protein
VSPRTQRLIARLTERTRDPQRVADHPPARRYRPVTKVTVADAERRLGFDLPDLLRALYTQVGNGGFGPAYGFVGLKGGARPQRLILVPRYQALRKVARQNPHWRWPE